MVTLLARALMTDPASLVYSGLMLASKTKASTEAKTVHWNTVPTVESDPGSLAVADWQPFRGPFQRWPRTMDTVLAFFSFFLTLQMLSPGIAEIKGDVDPAIATLGYGFAGLLAVVGNFALVWRRRFPLQVHAIVVGSAVLTMTNSHIDGIFGLAFSLYSLGRYAANSKVSALGMLIAVLFGAINMFVLKTAAPGSLVALGLMFLFWYVGRRLRFRGEYYRLLKERAVYLERHKTEEAEQAVAQERTRIARELHDVVAHQLSLMTVQAGAAKTVATSDLGAALDAMGAVESAGRQALTEMRHLLNVLRQDRRGGELAPQPGCADLASLAAEVTAAGTNVNLETVGPLWNLPARVDLALYRIVQESLTNVIKHAGTGASVTVRVELRDDAVELFVSDNGQGAGALPGPGYGIAGMRERVAMLGGRLSATGGNPGGFVVEAFLPIRGVDP